MVKYGEMRKELKELGCKKQAEIYRRFFKTGKGEYGEGDIFWGIRVPVLRKVAKNYSGLDLPEIEEFLQDPVHEVRMTALLLLIDKFSKGKETEKREIYEIYLKNIRKHINNWDLVDLSAPWIMGGFLKERKKERRKLYQLAQSPSLWERRVAMLSCLTFIRNNDFEDALGIAEKLLEDKHDLIHKAVGWMLREIGKRNGETEERFLKKHKGKIPRTALRYAIEKFPEKKRKGYLFA